jgi:multicomponent Na+:H+ antiporter subunit B
MILGGNFLEYSYLSASPVVGQQIGIIIIELGVGITVFAVMMLIFYMFAKRSE